MIEWRYLSNRANPEVDFRHALYRHGSYGELADVAVCGAEPNQFGVWSGSGSQSECERLVWLKKCPACDERVSR